MKRIITYLLGRAARIALFVCALMIGGGISAWGDVMEPLKPPYSYGFEDNNLSEAGWTVINSNASSGIVSGNSPAAHTGTYKYRFYKGTSSGDCLTEYLISPKLESVDNGITVSFYYNSNTEYTARTFNVGYSISDKEITSFTWLSNDITYTAKGWREFNESFPTGVKYIAIRHMPGGNYQDFFIDDICISPNLKAPAPEDLLVSNISYNSASLGWTKTGVETQWQIKYNNGADFDPDNEGTQVSEYPTDDNPYTLTGLEAETTCYVYIRAYVDESSQSDWVGTSFTTPEQYPTPTDFALDGFTATTATLSWNNGVGTTPSAWQIKYSTTQGFNPDNTGVLVDGIDSNPYTLENLTDGTTYYARIRADYGSSHFSDWSNQVEFTPTNIINLPVIEGSATAGVAPIYGSYVNAVTRTQFIIPSAALEGMQNRQITKLTFSTASGASYENLSYGSATFEVYLKEIDKTTFGVSPASESWGTLVYNANSLSVSNHLMEIILDVPYNYTTGNLMVGFKQKNTASSTTYTSWLGVKDSNYNTLYGYDDNTNSRSDFTPNITITSVPITDPVQMGLNGYTTFASPRALDLASLPSGLKAYKAAVEGKTVKFTEIGQAVPANTGMLLEGTAGVTYNIPVVKSGTTPVGNDFEVNSTGGTFSGESDYTYFGMKKATSAADPIVFATFTPSEVAIPTNKAYLKVLTSSLPDTSRLTCVFGDDTEGIQGVKQEASTAEVYYNLAGQRVDKPSKGLYIVNGNKVIIK